MLINRVTATFSVKFLFEKEKNIFALIIGIVLIVNKSLFCEEKIMKVRLLLVSLFCTLQLGTKEIFVYCSRLNERQWPSTGALHLRMKNSLQKVSHHFESVRFPGKE